jgi:hypothetical protein
MLQDAIEISNSTGGDDDDNSSDDDGGNSGDYDEILAKYFEKNAEQKEAFEKLPKAVQDASKDAFIELAKKGANELVVQNFSGPEIPSLPETVPQERKDANLLQALTKMLLCP